MDSLKIANIIKNVVNRTSFFEPSIVSGKINIEHVRKAIQFDLDTEVTELDKVDENTTFFLLEYFDQAAEILTLLNNGNEPEKFKEVVNDFVKEHKINTRQGLYFKVYLAPST